MNDEETIIVIKYLVNAETILLSAASLRKALVSLSILGLSLNTKGDETDEFLAGRVAGDIMEAVREAWKAEEALLRDD